MDNIRTRRFPFPRFSQIILIVGNGRWSICTENRNRILREQREMESTQAGLTAIPFHSEPAKALACFPCIALHCIALHSIKAFIFYVPTAVGTESLAVGITSGQAKNHMT
jgi:hypothetical protein